MNPSQTFLFPVLLAATAVQAQTCSDNFKSSGNFLTGTTYKTQASLPGVQAAQAYQRALQFTMENGFTVQSANPQLGQISATQTAQSAKGRSMPLNIVVRDDGGGTTLTLNYALAAGQMAPEAAIRTHFCKTIEAAGTAGAPAAGPGGAVAIKTSAPRPQPRGVSALTDAQVQAIAKAIRKGPHPATLKEGTDELWPTLDRWVERIACINHYEGARSIDEFAAPRASMVIKYMHAYPMSFMRYHDIDQCLSVLRLQGWRMPADNALQFEVVFRADDSGETTTSQHEAVRQPDGSWLFRY